MPEVTNLATELSAALQRHSSAAACTHLGKTFSYAQLNSLADEFAHQLSAAGLTPGERLAIHLPNISQYLIVALAAFKAGLTIVNSNPLDSAEGLRLRLDDSEAAGLVTLMGNAAVRNSRPLLSRPLQVWETAPADLHSVPVNWLINSIWRYRSGARSLADTRRLKLRGSGAAIARADTTSDALAALQYTGGTTGLPKGVMLSHDNLLTNIRQLQQVLADFDFKPGTTVLLPLPLYHIYAFTVALACLVQGFHIVLIPDPRNIAALLKTWKRYPVEVFFGLPTLFSALAAHPQSSSFDWSGLRTTFSGGMGLPAGVRASWEQCTGSEIYQAYGLSETSPLVSCNPRHDNRPETVGPPVPDTEVRVVSLEGSVLPVGEAGELQVRGAQVMQGYWQQPEATAEVLDADGWFSTGDIAVLDEDNYIRITDRLKDLVIVSGFNVYPAEVENCLSLHDAVLECAVVGQAHPRSGEQLIAVVVLKQPCGEEELRQHCRTHLAAYKVPAKVIEVESLPKSPVGKILRRGVRELLNPQD